MTALQRYIDGVGRMLAFREAGNEAAEESVMDELDLIWYGMSEAERTAAREWSAQRVKA